MGFKTCCNSCFWRVPWSRPHLQTALPLGWAGKDEATASEPGSPGLVLQVFQRAVGQGPSLTSYLLLSLAQHLSVICNLRACQGPTRPPPQVCTTGSCHLLDKDSRIISPPLLLFIRYVILAGNSYKFYAKWNKIQGNKMEIGLTVRVWVVGACLLLRLEELGVLSHCW